MATGKSCSRWFAAIAALLMVVSLSGCFDVDLISVFPIVHIFTKIEGNFWMNPFVPLEGIASLYLLYFQRQVATSKCYVFDFAVVRVPLHPN